MRASLPAFIMVYFALASGQADPVNRLEARDIALDGSDIVDMIDSHVSSIINDVRSAYSSAATKLPPSLVPEVGALLPAETAAEEESGASSGGGVHTALLYGFFGTTAGWIMFA